MIGRIINVSRMVIIPLNEGTGKHDLNKAPLIIGNIKDVETIEQKNY